MLPNFAGDSAPNHTAAVIVLKTVVKIIAVPGIHAGKITHSAGGIQGRTGLCTAVKFSKIVVAFDVCSAQGITGAIIGHSAYVDYFS